VRGCEDAACSKRCDGAHADVAPHRRRVYACVCRSCGAECTAIGACRDECVDTVKLPLLTTPPNTLADTGLYVASTNSSNGTRTWTLAPYVREFHPAYELWSDGALKKRYMYIPDCSAIDTSDMDHWNFPVGTRLWKEFDVPGKDPNVAAPRVETRLIHRFGPGPDDWIFAAYQWQPVLGSATPDSPENTTFSANEVLDANGTSHDIPSVTQCKNCHTKLAERVLGFSAFQLSHTGPGETMTGLSDAGWLTIGARDGFHPPGDAVASAALGYLHANCGNCHNDAFRPVEPPPLMRLLVKFRAVEATDTFTSLVGVQTINMDFSAYERIEAGNPDRSEIIMRMRLRPPLKGAMPPLGTETMHAEGVNAVSAWIKSLPSGDH
jgi:hypothetical protein